MVEDKPARVDSDRGRAETDLVCVPPPAGARGDDHAVVPPVDKVRREGDPHVRSEGASGDGPMEHREAPVDALGGGLPKGTKATA